MSWHYSRAQAAEFSAAGCLDGVDGGKRVTKNIKRLRALLRHVPVLIRDDDSLRKLWVDERDQSEWSRHVASIKDDNIAAWVVDGPAAARAVADDCERAKLEHADLRARLETAEWSSNVDKKHCADLVASIRAALKEAGIEQMVDEEGDKIESLADAVRRALKGASGG